MCTTATSNVGRPQRENKNMKLDNKSLKYEDSWYYVVLSPI